MTSIKRPVEATWTGIIERLLRATGLGTGSDSTPVRRTSRKRMQRVQEWPLPGQKLLHGQGNAEPGTLVYLGKFLSDAGTGRPLHGKQIAFDGPGIDVSLDGPGMNEFSTWLLKGCQRSEFSRNRQAGFLGKLTFRSLKRLISFLDLSFGNRPCPLILAGPIRTAGMDQEDFNRVLP